MYAVGHRVSAGKLDFRARFDRRIDQICPEIAVGMDVRSGRTQRYFKQQLAARTEHIPA